MTTAPQPRRTGQRAKMRAVRYMAMAICSLALVSLGEDLLADQARCQTVSAGAETDTLTGSIQNVGQAVIGRADNGMVFMHAGTIVCYPLDSLPPIQGDCDNDGDVDLLDLAAFEDCLSGPRGGLDGGCECADIDGDGDVDLGDVADFQTAFAY